MYAFRYLSTDVLCNRLVGAMLRAHYVIWLTGFDTIYRSPMFPYGVEKCFSIIFNTSNSSERSASLWKTCRGNPSIFQTAFASPRESTVNDSRGPVKQAPHVAQGRIFLRLKSKRGDCGREPPLRQWATSISFERAVECVPPLRLHISFYPNGRETGKGKPQPRTD